MVGNLVFDEIDGTKETLYPLHIVGMCNSQDCFDLLSDRLEYHLSETESKEFNLLGIAVIFFQADLHPGFVQLLEDFIQDVEMTVKSVPSQWKMLSMHE